MTGKLSAAALRRLREALTPRQTLHQSLLDRKPPGPSSTLKDAQVNRICNVYLVAVTRVHRSSACRGRCVSFGFTSTAQQLHAITRAAQSGLEPGLLPARALRRTNCSSQRLNVCHSQSEAARKRERGEESLSGRSAPDLRLIYGCIYAG